MNISQSTGGLAGRHPTRNQLAHYDREARRLRAEFAGDRLLSFFIAFDQFVRRIAARLSGSR